MNDDRLEELLNEKRNSRPVFVKTGEEFADEFFRKVHSLPAGRRRFRWVLWAAAGLLLAAGVVLPRMMQPDTAPGICRTAGQYDRLREAVHLFGSRAAVFFFGDELVTGERDEDEAGPVNFVEIDLVGRGGKLRLSLACTDDDSIRLDSDTATGTVVVSRSDSGTLVVDLEIDYEGRPIRTAVPVRKRGGKAYYGTAEAS